MHAATDNSADTRAAFNVPKILKEHLPFASRLFYAPETYPKHRVWPEKYIGRSVLLKTAKGWEGASRRRPIRKAGGEAMANAERAPLDYRT